MRCRLFYDFFGRLLLFKIFFIVAGGEGVNGYADGKRLPLPITTSVELQL